MIDLPVGRTPPNQARAFLHKKLLGGFSKLAGIGAAIGIPGAGTAALVSRALAGGGGRRTRTATARVSEFSRAEKRAGSRAKFPPEESFFASRSGRGPCEDPDLVRNPRGQCVAPGSPFGTRTLTGEPVLGIYGAGIRPGSMIVDRAICGKKMQLGDDGICYNKSQISNKQRMWPAGRKPLLTGGDMRAISVASRAGKRMDDATTRLRKLGMMKKAAAPRRPTKAEQQHQQLALVHATK